MYEYKMTFWQPCTVKQQLGERALALLFFHFISRERTRLSRDRVSAIQTRIKNEKNNISGVIDDYDGGEEKINHRAGESMRQKIHKMGREREESGKNIEKGEFGPRGLRRALKMLKSALC